MSVQWKPVFRNGSSVHGGAVRSAELETNQPLLDSASGSVAHPLFLSSRNVECPRFLTPQPARPPHI